MATSQNGQFTRLSGETPDSSVEITGVEPNAHYFYKVAGVNSADEQGPFSTTVEGWASLPAPDNLTASQGTYSDRIALNWDDVPGAYQYFVYQASSATGTYTKLTSGSDITASSVNITGSTPGTHYYYKVTASDAYDNEGAQSAYAEGWAKQQLAAPSGLTASQGTYGNKIALAWSVVTGASKYYIYRSTSAAGTYTKLTTEPTSTSADITDGTVNTHYHFKVAAVDSSNVEGLQSTSAEGWMAYSTIQWVEDSSGYYQLYTNDPAKYGVFFTDVFTGWSLASGSNLTVSVKKLSGDASQDYGLIFYYVDSLNYYYFSVDTLGYYKIWLCLDGDWSVVQEWTSAGSLLTGYNQINSLKDHYWYDSGQLRYEHELSINSTIVYTIYDPSYSMVGKTGFAVQVGSSSDESFPASPVDVRFKMTSPYALPNLVAAQSPSRSDDELRLLGPAMRGSAAGPAESESALLR